MKRTNWTKDEDEFLRQNYLTLKYKEIGEKLDRSKEAVGVRAQKLNLSKSNLWTDEDVEFLIKNYESMSNNEIGKILKRPEKLISSKINWLGHQRKNPWTKYPIKENYFENWSANMAYILGYTTSDGYIYNKTNTLRYHCNQKDIEILEFIKNEISPSRPIKLEKQYCKEKNKYYNCCNLSISSLPLVDSLLQYNLFQKKSGREILPKIPAEFKPHYLRGLFDGDGCICIKNCFDKRRNKYNKRFTYSIISASQSFLESVKSVLCFDYGSIYKRPGCYIIEIGKQQSIIDLFDFMYSDGGFYLRRKYNKFIDTGLV